MPRLLALCAITALLLVGCTESRPGALGGITATVFLTPGGTALTLTPDGTPAVGAEVRVENLGIRALTDAGGHAALTFVPTGAQTVFISYPGVQSLAVPVTVAPGLTPLTAPPVAVTRRWTVLIFMNGNNDLEPNGVDNMNQLETAPDSEAVTTTVQFARSPLFDTTNGNWTGARRFKIEHDADPQAIDSPVIEDLGDVDMGQPATLRTFIAWGAARYPAQHYLLVIWNHGSGWKSRASAGALTRGVSFDDVHNSFISTQQLPAALTAGVPLDVTAFDASLMQMLEIAYEMRAACPFIVGSEESPPASGYPYDRIQRDLVAAPTMAPRDAATMMARETLAAYGAGTDITQSVLETDRLDALAGALDTLAGALLPHAAPDAAALAVARDTTEHYAQLEYKDLADYATHAASALSGDPAVQAAATGVTTAVTQATVAEFHGALHPHSHGVSIYLPTPSTYPAFAANYATLDLTQRTRWATFLGAQIE